MIDIVIPLGIGSPWQDNELRYCLRGIVKHLQGYRDIYIVGHKPAWLQNVIHIPFKEVHLASVKEANICNKVLKACNNQGLSTEFLFMNDDHFLLQDVRAGLFPFYHSGTIGEKLEGMNPFNAYVKTVLQTAKLLGRPALHYDIHSPVIFSRDCFTHIMNQVNWQKHWGYLMKSIYCNQMNVDGQYLEDCKINERMDKDSIESAFTGRPFFSIGNAGLNDDMKEVLQQLYPQMCKYEISQ